MTNTDPAAAWMSRVVELWPEATPADLAAAREYIPLMASPEEAVNDLEAAAARGALLSDVLDAQA